MSCMNTVMANRHQDDKDRAERRADYTDQRAIELMEPGEDCDPCDGYHLAEALDESSAKEKTLFGQLIRDGKYADAAIFLRGISHAYWAAKANEQALEETA